MKKPKNGYVPVEKMSKKARKKYTASRRSTWGPLNPVTRRTNNPKAYRRNAEKREIKALLVM